MREIKFRLYSTEEEEMFFNENIVNIDLVCNFARIENERFKGFFDFGEGEESILMQYTGLKDKNGKEIYEGDIVKTYESNIICEVIFSEGAMFMLRWNDKKWGNNEYHHYGVGAFILEVIGNIYENPELLEGN